MDMANARLIRVVKPLIPWFGKRGLEVGRDESDVHLLIPHDPWLAFSDNFIESDEELLKRLLAVCERFDQISTLEHACKKAENGQLSNEFDFCRFPIEWIEASDLHATFYQLYHARKSAHLAQMMKWANQACDAWRENNKALAIQLAKQCHVINLFLSGNEKRSAHGSAIRLDSVHVVEMCRAAGKDMDVVYDALWHIHFGSFEQIFEKEFEKLDLRCTCATRANPFKDTDEP